MAVVIGLDLGNFNSYPSYIEDLEPSESRMGGRPVDLLPAGESAGIPSVFFYTEGKPFLAGRSAVTGMARPERNRIRYLKQSLDKPLVIDGKPVVIDGKAWSYNDAIREVAQSVLREANRELDHITRQTTDLVALAYPASFGEPQRDRLAEIVSSATLEDGRHFRVVGTIREPAAAALDYLAQAGQAEESTVMVFDLGGGTFDLCVVSCYPRGRKRADGTVVYYDLHVSDGLREMGGRDFDNEVFHLLRGKLEAYLEERGLPMTGQMELSLRRDAEQIKKELSFPPYRTLCEVYVPALEDSVELELSREEFENAPRVQDMLRQMTDMARSLLTDPTIPKPDTIVLTGGSCRMPMIRRALERALPEYADRIGGFREYRLESAVSYGAARFGVPEGAAAPPVPEPDDTCLAADGTPLGRILWERDPDRPLEAWKPSPFDPQHPHVPFYCAQSGISPIFVPHLPRTYGIRYFRSGRDEMGFIVPFVPHGAPLPGVTPWARGACLEEESALTYELYEAVTQHPDPDRPDRDWRLVKTLKLDPSAELKPGDETEVCLSCQRSGAVTEITMQARRSGGSQITVSVASIQ